MGLGSVWIIAEKNWMRVGGSGVHLDHHRKNGKVYLNFFFWLKFFTNPISIQCIQFVVFEEGVGVKDILFYYWNCLCLQSPLKINFIKSLNGHTIFCCSLLLDFDRHKYRKSWNQKGQLKYHWLHGTTFCPSINLYLP